MYLIKNVCQFLIKQSQNVSVGNIFTKEKKKKTVATDYFKQKRKNSTQAGLPKRSEYF